MWLLAVPSGSVPAQVGQVAGSFSPAIAAVVVRRWVTGEGFAHAGLRPRLRLAARYYLFAWLFPIPFLAGAAALATASGLPVHWSDFGAVLGALATALALTPVIFGEELGWRSYLQPRLLASRPVLGAVTVGAIWGTWHLPAVLLGLEPHQHGGWSIALFPWFMIPFSIILGWLWQRTGTVWVPALAHSSVNVALAAGGGMLSISGGYGDLWYSSQGIIASLIFIAFAAWIALTGRLSPARAQPTGPELHADRAVALPAGPKGGGRHGYLPETVLAGGGRRRRRGRRLPAVAAEDAAVGRDGRGGQRASAR
jgi:membrane protease YdiL (CAAX protease family)